MRYIGQRSVRLVSQKFPEKLQPARYLKVSQEWPSYVSSRETVKKCNLPGDKIKISGFLLLDSSKTSCRSNPILVTNVGPKRSWTNNLIDSTKHSGRRILTIINRWKLVRAEASQPIGEECSLPMKTFQFLQHRYSTTVICSCDKGYTLLLR